MQQGILAILERILDEKEDCEQPIHQQTSSRLHVF